MEKIFEKRPNPTMFKEVVYSNQLRDPLSSISFANFNPRFEASLHRKNLYSRGPRFVGRTANEVFKKVLKAIPTVSPFDDPFTKPKEVTLTINRMGVDFFKRIRKTANLM
jgi:hypothetical protein